MPEIWDLYDIKKQKTGAVIERNKIAEIPEGRYHLAVDVWVRTPDGRLLITQRSKSKPSYPLFWECSGGAVISGEDSIDGAIRELSEETGITVESSELKLINTVTYSNYIMDVYLCERDIKISDVVIQEEEVADARLATEEEILGMIKNGEFMERVWKRFSERLER